MAENKKKSTSTKKTTKKPVVKTTTKKVASKTVTEKKASKAKAPVVKKATKVEETKKVETPVVKETTKVETKKKANKNSFVSLIKNNSRNIILGLICILLIFNIVLIVLGHKVKLENGKEVIASIDGKNYTAEQLFDNLKQRYGKDALLTLIDDEISSKELSNDDLTKAKKEAQEYIDEIKKQYESAGYNWSDVLKQYGYANEEALLNEYLVTVKAQIVVKNYLGKKLTDDEIKKYYEENIFGTYTVKHILITPDTTDEMSEEDKSAAEESAKATAQEVINRYANGEDWATLVSTYSEDDGSKDSEGLIENFTKGDMVDEFFNASVALKDNEYTKEPVKSTYGYHVILKVSSTERPSLKDSKEKVISALIDKKLNEDANLYSNTWVKLRKDYKLSINDTDIKSEYEKAISE